MTTLFSLDAPNRNIRDLTGLEFAVKLKWLNVGVDRVGQDLVNSNDISNLAPLSDLTGLVALNLWGNSISDVSGLAGLTGIQMLILAENNVTDVSALSNMVNLTLLGLLANSIRDVSPLSGCARLEILYLHNNNISDVSALSGLSRLETLILSSNRISDLAPLVANAGLGSGDRVDLRNNPLNATSINEHIPALRRRGVDVRFVATGSTVAIPDRNLRAVIEDSLGKSRGAPITRAEMAALTVLAAPNRNIRNLTGLEYAVSLRGLDLGGESAGRNWVNSSEISDLAPLSGLTSLQALILDFNNISDISALSELTGLLGLNLWGNRIRNISALSGLTMLEILGLSENRITSLSALSELTRLELVALADNRISDLAPLVSNSGLGRGDEVDVRNNPLSAISINALIPALRLRGVTVYFGASKVAAGKKTRDLLPAVMAKYRARWPEAGGIVHE